MRSSFPSRALPCRRPAGFTLVELMVGMAVASIVILGVASAFVGVTGAYQSESKIKSAVENSRTSLSYLERVVRLAGYGVDPRFAFDFQTGALGSYGNTKDNYPTTPATYVTDDLAFRYRDPAFMRRGKLDSGGTKITLDGTATFGVPIKDNQPMIVACPVGGEYITLRTTEGKVAGDKEIAVETYGAPFPTTVPACASTGAGEFAPFVFLMYDVRIRVMEYDGQPYLVAFHTLDDPSSNTAFSPIAVGVENFQVAYVMNRPATGGTAPDGGSGNSNWILMDAGSESLPNDTAANAPTFEMPYAHANRFTTHQANIRAVRLSLVIRNDSKSGRLNFPRPALENQATWGTMPDGYFRSTVSTTVPLPNLKSRTFFVPPLKPSGNTTDLNVGGG